MTSVLIVHSRTRSTIRVRRRARASGRGRRRPSGADPLPRRGGRNRDGQEGIAGQRDGTAHHDIAKLGPERHARCVLAACAKEPEQLTIRETCPSRARPFQAAAGCRSRVPAAPARVATIAANARNTARINASTSEDANAMGQSRNAAWQRGRGSVPDIISLRASAARYSIRSVRLIGYMHRPSEAPSDRAQFRRLGTANRVPGT